MRILKEGAEAQISETMFFGLRAVKKTRVSKGYREKPLDSKILAERLRTDCNLISRAKKAGVRTPLIYAIDPDQLSITMELIEGKTLKDKLNAETEEAELLCAEAGEMVSRLHSAGIIHGDLTTSNFICSREGLVLSDFGLGSFSEKLEDRAVDLLCFKKSFLSTHYSLAKKWPGIEKAYSKGFARAKEVLGQMKAVEARARYH